MRVQTGPLTSAVRLVLFGNYRRVRLLHGLQVNRLVELFAGRTIRSLRAIVLISTSGHVSPLTIRLRLLWHIILILLLPEFILLIFILMVDKSRGSSHQATIIVHNILILLASPHTFAFRIE